MIQDDLIITRRLSEKPICKVTIEIFVQSNTLFNIAPLKALPQWLYLVYLTYDGSTYNGTNYNDNSQAKCFNS